MRDLPADSLEYFGDTAFGKTALLGGIEADGVGTEGLPVVVTGAAGLAADGVAAAGVEEGAAVASAPHSAFRNSFHFMPLRVPAVWAALYLALHSCSVRA